MKTCCLKGTNGYQYIIPLDKILYLKAEPSYDENVNTKYFVVFSNKEIQITGDSYVILYKKLSNEEEK